MLLNCGAGEDSWQSLGLQEDQVTPKGNQSWVFTGGTHAEAETPILWPPDVKNWLILKDPDAGEIEGRRRGWQRVRWSDGITDRPWVWVSSGSWWWTGKPGLLQSMGSQRVGYDWATERLNWEYPAVRVNPSVNCRLWVTVTCQCRFSGDQGPALMGCW